MKLNWGKSIVLAMVLFIGFIMFMVVQMIVQPEYDHDLVVEEYYKKELTLNDKLDHIENGREFESDIKFLGNTNGLLLQFPESLTALSNLNVEAYRPSDKDLDFNTNLNIDENREALVNKPLARGIWKFSISFSLEDKEYLISKTLNIQ